MTRFVDSNRKSVKKRPERREQRKKRSKKKKKKKTDSTTIKYANTFALSLQIKMK